MAFPYKPLDPTRHSIRLLRLRPHLRKNNISCEITHYSLDECPPYHAVSYCWGESTGPQQILLEEEPLFVRDNLWQLLSQFRLNRDFRLFWIDAICINQNNTPEKNQQVALMSRIYGGAVSVIVWLGPSVEGTNLAFEAMARFQSYPARGWTGRRWKYWSSNEENRRGKRPRQYLCENEAKAFSELCNRNYWHRTWIIQEFVLSQQVEYHCGASKCNEKSFNNFATELKSYAEEQPRSGNINGLSTIVGAAPLRLIERRVNKRQTRLCELIDEYKDSLCTDPRDKVYALLSLASDRDDGRAPTADYDKSAMDVYGDIMNLYFRYEYDMEGFISMRMLLDFYQVLANTLQIQHSMLVPTHARPYKLQVTPIIAPSNYHQVADCLPLDRLFKISIELRAEIRPSANGETSSRQRGESLRFPADGTSLEKKDSTMQTWWKFRTGDHLFRIDGLLLDLVIRRVDTKLELIKLGCVREGSYTTCLHIQEGTEVARAYNTSTPSEGLSLSTKTHDFYLHPIDFLAFNLNHENHGKRGA